MTKGMKVFLIICAGIIGVGILFSIIGYVCGGIGGLNHIENRMPWVNFGVSEGKEQQSFDTKEFTSIDVNADYGTVQLIEGDQYKVEVVYDKKWSAPAVESSGGKLTVKDVDKRRDWFNFNIFGHSDRATEIKVYYPKGTSFDDVILNCDLGDVQIGNIKAKTLKVDADAGNVEMKNVTADMLILRLDAGSAEGTNISTKGLDANLNMGHLELDGTFAGKTKAYCDLGDCIFTTNLPKADYSIDANVDIGGYEVDGAEGTGNYTVKNSTAKHIMELKSDLGSVTLNFR